MTRVNSQHHHCLLRRTPTRNHSKHVKGFIRSIALISLLNYFVLNGLVAAAIGLASRTGSDSDNEVHLRDKIDVIASLTYRWLHREFARLPVYWHIHEAVESAWNTVGRNVVFA